jgi:predicted RNA-binding Zn-ribbon protein involved in translation (DUF1610 family)
MLPVHFDVDVSVGEQFVDFRCSRCGHLAQASVKVTGTGLKVGQASLSKAALDARVGAAQTAQLAPCPRCGHRNRAALAKVLLVGATIGAFAAFTAWLVATEQLHVAARGDAGVQVGLATFLAVLLTTTALKLRNVRRRVRFHRVVR